MASKIQPYILLVEDNLELCQGWEDIFDLLGFKYASFQRGLNALSQADEIERCNLVITDYYLPDINGVDLIKRLREVRPDLKAILLTGSRESSVVSSVKQIPACELLHKPLNIETLEAAIERALG